MPPWMTLQKIPRAKHMGMGVSRFSPSECRIFVTSIFIGPVSGVVSSNRMRCALHNIKHCAVRILGPGAHVSRCAANDGGSRNCKATLQFRHVASMTESALSREGNQQPVRGSL